MENHAERPSASKLDEWLGIDLRQYARVLRKRWRIIATSVFLVVGGTALWTSRQPKIFEATATVVIDPMAPQILQGVKDVVELGTGSYWANREFYETQYRIVQSREVAELAVEKLGLDHDPTYPSEEVSPEAKAKLDHPQLLLAQTKVQPVKDSRIAHIVVSDRNAERAARIANAMAQAYIDRNLEQKVEGSQVASVWLGDQVVALRDKLRKSELALYEFRREKQLLDVDLNNKQTMTNRNLEIFSQKLADVRALRLEMEAERRIILAAQENVDAQESLPIIRDNAIVQQLRTNYVSLTRQLAELEATYLEKNPKIASINRQIEAIQRDYREEITKILKAFENRFEALLDQERALTRTIAEEKKQAIELAKIEVEFKPLARETEQNHRLYELVNTRQKDTNLAGLIRNNNVRILDSARPAKRHTKPRLTFNLALALGLSLGLGIGLAVLVDSFDNTIKSQEQAEGLLGVPVLGLVPVIGGAGAFRKEAGPKELQDRDLSVINDPKSTAAEACRSIRTNLMFLSPETPLRAFVVTSPGPQEGKTTTAISVAATIAQAGTRVLLVDTDLRRPRIHKSFGLPNDVGVANIVVNTASIESAVQKTSVPTLDVLTSGPHPPNPAELLHTVRFRSLIDELKARYDLVIFDSPPTSAVTDPAIISNLTDGVILVLRAAYTTSHAAAYARRQLTDAKARVLGAIVNRVDLADKTYNFYRYKYYRNYQYGYSANEG